MNLLETLDDLLQGWFRNQRAHQFRACRSISLIAASPSLSLENKI